MAIGIDIGYSDIKIVQLENGTGGPVIQNIGKKSVVDDLSKFNPEKIGRAEWVATLHALLDEMKINPKRIKNVVSSINGTNVSIKQVSTLEMGNEELHSALEFEAKKHIPMDGTEVVLDYHILGSDPKEIDKILVLLVATTKTVIERHNAILTESGFKNNVFDADPVAVLNNYLNQRDLPDDGTDVLLQIGNQRTTMVVWGKQQQLFTREINIGGYHFSRAVMKANDMSFMDAEAKKIEVGVDAVKSDSSSSEGFSIAVAEKTVFTNLVDDIRKTLRFYMKSNSKAFFNKFYLTGGSAGLPGLQAFIAEALNVEVEISDPFQGLIFNQQVDNPSQYAVAIGCALHSAMLK